MRASGEVVVGHGDGAAFEAFANRDVLGHGSLLDHVLHQRGQELGGRYVLGHEVRTRGHFTHIPLDQEESCRDVPAATVFLT